jgi:hypothetical protein
MHLVDFHIKPCEQMVVFCRRRQGMDDIDCMIALPDWLILQAIRKCEA